MDINENMVALAGGIDGADPEASLGAIRDLTSELPLVGDIVIDATDVEDTLIDLCTQADCPAADDLEEIIRDAADVLDTIKKTVDDIEDIVDDLLP